MSLGALEEEIEEEMDKLRGSENGGGGGDLKRCVKTFRGNHYMVGRHSGRH